MDIQTILDEFAKSKFTAIGSIEGLYNSKSIIQYDLNGNKINKFNSFRQIAKQYTSGRSDIKQCLKGKRLQAKGYVWKYE